MYAELGICTRCSHLEIRTFFAPCSLAVCSVSSPEEIQENWISRAVHSRLCFHVPLASGSRLFGSPEEYDYLDLLGDGFREIFSVLARFDIRHMFFRQSSRLLMNFAHFSA